jgi:hypothetical protein
MSHKSGPEQRKTHRVVFERGYPVHMMAIDGTWRRSCTMEDVSDGGARLTVDVLMRQSLPSRNV